MNTYTQSYGVRTGVVVKGTGVPDYQAWSDQAGGITPKIPGNGTKQPLELSGLMAFSYSFE